MRVDVLICGGGIVGLATAYQLQQLRPDLAIMVLEKESKEAQHQSSRNSGVIHSGIYYKPGSLRAINCKRGYDLLLDFCQKHHIPYEICGKIITAVEQPELARLDQILERGTANGLVGIRKISGAEAREIEPAVAAIGAVWVPQAGIIDYGTVAAKYRELLEAHGNRVLTGQKVTAISRKNNQVYVTAGGDGAVYEARVLVNCAGLYADKIARLAGLNPQVQVLPFRGEFYDLIPERQFLVKNLIYPLPNPNFPFLGVHFTRMIQGGIESGPNAVLAFRREGYSRWDVHAGELSETLSYIGFQRIARKYWRDGWLEMKRSYLKSYFVKALQRLIPDITAADLVPGRTGVRAMACDPQGNMLDDFLILEAPGMVHVVNAPSPAATASLSVGLTVAEKVLQQC